MVSRAQELNSQDRPQYSLRSKVCLMSGTKLWSYIVSVKVDDNKYHKVTV